MATTAFWVERILYYLVVLDWLGYAILTLTKGSHDRETHYIFKVIPLNPMFAAYYLFLIAWLGMALYRLGIVP